MQLLVKKIRLLSEKLVYYISNGVVVTFVKVYEIGVHDLKSNLEQL